MFAALIVFKSIIQRMISSYLFARWQCCSSLLASMASSHIIQYCHLTNKYEEIIR